MKKDLITFETAELPREWCVKVTDEIIDKLIELRKSINRPNPEDIKNFKYCVADSSILNYGGNYDPLHKEITTEQFKQHFMKDKEIIGYKLIKPEYEKVAIQALGLGNKTAYNPFIITGMISYYVPKIEELGIMDWFKPVYKEYKPELPKIKGYEGIFSGDCIVYGCANLSKSWFTSTKNRNIKIMTLDSGVIITEDQINQIRKVIEYNNK